MNPRKQLEIPPQAAAIYVSVFRLAAALSESTLEAWTTNASVIASQVVIHIYVRKTHAVKNTFPCLFANRIRATSDAKLHMHAKRR